MNILFWSLLLLMAMLAIWPLLRVLMRPPESVGANRLQQNKEIYRDRLTRLESDNQNNLLPEKEYTESLSELETAMSEELLFSVQGHDEKPQKKNFLIYSLFALIPVMSIVLYLYWGEYLAIDSSNYAQIEKQHRRAEAQTKIKQLEKELQLAPDNINNRLALANAYVNTKDLVAANEILSSTYQSAPDNVDVMLMYAEVLGEINNRSFAGIPADLIRKALQLAPQSRKAQWLASVLAVQERNFEPAIAMWAELLKTAEDPEERSFLEGLLAQTGTHSSVNKDKKPVAATEQIRVKVSLSKKFLNKVNPSDTVFIFAKAYVDTGDAPRMPLAILKKQVSDLPAEFGLSDADSMMPAIKLSSFEKVIVGARISKAGDAIARSGDLQSLSQPVSTKSNAVILLEISEVVQ